MEAIFAPLGCEEMLQASAKLWAWEVLQTLEDTS